MKYTKDEVLQYVAEEDVKFIRMAFCDVRGRQKNVSIMPGELSRAFENGISFDASAIEGFGGEVRSDLFLRPDPSTLSVLPWRPEHGRVVRMYCTVFRPDGTLFAPDTRTVLIRAIEAARAENIEFSFGSETEFYLFCRDENGEPTHIPYDHAGYMDIAPEDRGENVRREICLTLERMGIRPESSHHEEGPGQNEIDFRYADPLTAADDAVTFRSVVNTVAARSGLYADFSPKPLEGQPGNGMHINISARSTDGREILPQVIAGILSRVREMTAFFNTAEASYRRFGSDKAPGVIAWGRENRSQLIRIPAADGEYRRAELRSPDPLCNPYLVYALLIRAGLAGIREQAVLPPEAEWNYYAAAPEVRARFETLPATLAEAKAAARSSAFIAAALPEELVRIFTR
ncbi:MAG: glutamine synthetase family protein [Eubacteriales bacterium]